MEGRPLVTDRVVGRKTETGGDEALPASDYDPLTIATTTDKIPAVDLPPERMGGAYGRTWLTRFMGRPKRIGLLEGMSPEHRQLIHGHEIGHIVDELVGNFAGSQHSDDLRRIYNTFNNPDRSLRTGEAARDFEVTPQRFGYSNEDAAREYWAEAVHAYLANPNWLKSVAPGVAARIREVVNPSPLSKILQFNSFLPLSVALTPMASPSDAEAADTTPVEIP